MLKLRHIARLRRKEVRDLKDTLSSTFGSEPFPDEDLVEGAEVGDGRTALLVGGRIVGLVIVADPVLTVRGMLLWPATKRWVTVDMGAVPFVYNGADVMAPGIVDADRTIVVGDLVWVRDEKNLRPLAAGAALTTGEEMAVSEKGKSIRALHHVGDDLWKYGDVEPASPTPEDEAKP